MSAQSPDGAGGKQSMKRTKTGKQKPTAAGTVIDRRGVTLCAEAAAFDEALVKRLQRHLRGPPTTTAAGSAASLIVMQSWPPFELEETARQFRDDAKYSTLRSTWPSASSITNASANSTINRAHMCSIRKFDA